MAKRRLSRHHALKFPERDQHLGPVLGYVDAYQNGGIRRRIDLGHSVLRSICGELAKPPWKLVPQLSPPAARFEDAQAAITLLIPTALSVDLQRVERLYKRS